MMKTIGQVAAETKVSVHALRYYEKEGLLSSISRNDAGQRIYNTENIQAVLFIKRAQHLHFSLNEIKQLLQLSQYNNIPKESVRHLVKHKQQLITEHIDELIELRNSLEQLLISCEQSAAKEDCPIIKELKEP